MATGRHGPYRLAEKFVSALKLGATALAVVACSSDGSPPGGTGGGAPGGSSNGGSGGVAVSQGGSAGSVPAGAGTGGGGAPAGGTPAIGGSAPQAGSAGTASGGSSGAGGGGGGGGGGTGGTSAAGAGGSGEPGVAIFNGTDLSGFTAFREPATELTPEQALAIFKVEDGMIRVYGDAENGSTQARHTLVTTASYSKYKLWTEYKWGTKTFAPYANTQMYPRDAGILFHLHRDTTEVWPSSIEFQIKDGTTGDIFALYARCTSLGANGGEVFAENGSEVLVDGSNGFTQHSRSENFETADWNQLLLEVDEGVATYTVNGHIVNRVLSIMDSDGGPINSGPIAFQAEHAEVFYRNLRIQELP